MVFKTAIHQKQLRYSLAVHEAALVQTVTHTHTQAHTAGTTAELWCAWSAKVRSRPLLFRVLKSHDPDTHK